MSGDTTGGPAIGVHPTVTDQSMPLFELAVETELRGLQSIYFPEHTHIPVGSEQVRDGWSIPDRYKRTFDPFIACAFVAARTNLEVGTAISLVAQHDPIALAKAVATLDFLSQGRVILGVGFGYNRAEAADHGIPVHDRALVVEETVGLMRALWRSDRASFDGRYRHMSESWSWPKPPQLGGPPVFLGVRATPRNLHRVATWADGWIPMGSGLLTDDGFESNLRELRQRWQDAGRTGELLVCCFFQPDTAAHMRREIERGAELGVQRMQVFLEDRPRDDVLPILDALGAVVAKRVGS